MENEIEVLGRGIYTFSEAARYAGAHVNTVRSWFLPRGTSHKKPVLCSDYVRLEIGNLISFLDLIDVAVAAKLRSLGVSMQKVRAAYDRIAEDLGTDHPFCHRGIYTDGRDVFLKAAEELHDEMLYNVIKRQGLIEEVMRCYLQKMDYAEIRLLAERWRIAERVVIDPQVAFGSPVIAGRGTTTVVLARSYYAEDEDVNFVARQFKMDTESVLSAVDFEKRFGTTRSRLKAA